jgi:RNA polymerase sigma-70 factor (ECF subfamily)
MAIYVDDVELIAAHRAGDTGAFDELAREYRSVLYRHAFKRLGCEAAAEDAVQETFIRAYRALPKFSGEYRLGPWLHRIMQNVCIDEANRRRKDSEKTGRAQALFNPLAHAADVEEELRLDVDHSDLDNALKELSEPYREALVMRFVHEMDYDQVAEVAGVSEQNARARVSRARSAVRIALKGCAVFPFFLWGLLKRSEKIVSAATNSSSQIALSSPKSSIGLISQVAPQTSTLLPAVSETAANITPVVLPIVAKAAVGIGIVAAIMSPAPDSVVHQAVEEIRSSSAQISYAFEQPLVDEPSNQMVITASEIQNEESAEEILISPVENNADNTAEIFTSDSFETLSPSYIIYDDEIGEDSDPVAGTTGETNRVSFADQVTKGVGGRISAPGLSVEMLRPGNYNLLGFTQLELADSAWTGLLSDASYIKLYMDPDRDGRDRFDGLIELVVSESIVVEIRLAGFATSEGSTLIFDGVYRSVSNTDLLNRGIVSGSLNTQTDSGFGSLEIVLSS